MRIYKAPTDRFKYVFEYDFDPAVLQCCRMLKIKYGASNLNFQLGRWRFNSIQIAFEFKKMLPDVEIDASMQADAEKYEAENKLEKIRIENAIKLKQATDSKLEIKGLREELYPYQKIGVEFFLNSGGRAILADAPGLGKSFQSLAYIAHEKKKRTLVICPASVKFTWESECYKWTKLKPLVINSQKGGWPDSATLSNYQVVVINYDIIKKYFNDLSVIRWDCLVCDEFHYLKNSASNRSKYVKELSRNIPSVLLLSGTPMLNRPVELFNGLNIVDPQNWNDWFLFTKNYCGGHRGRFGWDASGATNIDELQKRIDHYFIRRTKEQVLKELPPRRFIECPVVLDKEAGEQYKMAEDSFIDYLREVKKKNIPENASAIQANKLVKLNELRQISSRGKIYAAEEIIQNLIDNDEKVVVFSSYNAPLEELHKRFQGVSMMLTGKTKNEDRKELINRFQNDKTAKVFLGGIKSAGVGITLTAAPNVVFLDYSWTPSDHVQAADRIYRIGQTADSVSVYQLFSKDTIDVDMKHTLESKQLLFDKLIEGKMTDSQQSISLTKDVLKTFEKRIK